MMRPHSFPMVCAVVAAVGAALLAGGGSAAALTGQPASARAVFGDGWGSAEEVPGTGQLNQGGFAYLQAVSCASPGDCSAAGGYDDATRQPRAFLVNETNGAWHSAEEIRGNLIRNHLPGFHALSCGSPGNCSAGGQYGGGQAFVVTETHGIWSRPLPLRGIAKLNAGGIAAVASMSCASTGNCSAGGTYTDSAFKTQVFVVSETHGRWHSGKQVPGSGALNKYGLATISSLSCGSAGNCSAGGLYYNASGHARAFLVSEARGRWGRAEKVRGTGPRDRGFATIYAVSCASAGNCSAGGTYTAASGKQQAFVVNRAHGRWGTAQAVPGSAALGTRDAQITSVSCASAGNCTAAGTYGHATSNGSAATEVFGVTETHGTWHTATPVPGIAALNTGGYATITTISCASAGNCSAGGTYTVSLSPTRLQAFVVTQAHGTWRTAIEVPGTAVLNQGGNAQITSISCASASHCSAAGFYTDSANRQQAFIIDKT